MWRDTPHFARDITGTRHLPSWEFRTSAGLLGLNDTTSLFIYDLSEYLI